MHSSKSEHREKYPSLYRRMTDRIIFGSLRLLAKALYGIQVNGLEHFETVKDKPVVIVANHASFLDAVMLALFLPVKPAFAIDVNQHRRFMKMPVIGRIMARFDMFPIDMNSPYNLKNMARLAQKNTPVMIFPEGRLTATGTIMQIFDGAGAIADMAKADIIGIHLQGFEFLRWATPHRNRNPKSFFPRLTMTATPPRQIELPEGLPPRQKRAARLEAMQKIMHELPLQSLAKNETLLSSLHKAASNFGRRHQVLSDPRTPGKNYGEFLTNIYGLAHLLEPHIPGKDPVGVLLPSSVSCSIAFYALQALDRPAAMLNAGAKAAAIASCVQTSRAKTVITSRLFVEKAKLENEIEALKSCCNIVYLEDIVRNLGIRAKIRIALNAHGYNLPARDKKTEKNPAVILFTSGSEGVPKGVALSHYNLLSNLSQIRSMLGFTVQDRVFNAMPMFHAFGLAGLNLPLHNGLHSYQYPTPLDGKTIPRIAYFNDTTIMFGTDTFLNLYARNASPDDFCNVRMLFAGAERLKNETYDKYVDTLNIRPNQAYGMTEASPAVTMNLPGLHRRGTVGRFLPGIEWRLEKVDGMAEGGKLYVRGANVMMGYIYHDNPGVIVPPVNGWHDTGDIVTIDPEGFVRIAGRAKRFAKIGGEMVGLDSIEQIARYASSMPDSMHAAILKQDEKSGDSVILFTTDSKIRKGDLSMAAHKAQMSVLGLPRDSDIHHVGEMPLLPTGKTDYVRLKHMLAEDFGNAASHATHRKIPTPGTAPSP